MTFDPTKYGLTANLSAETLIQARQEFEKLVESLKSEDADSVKDVPVSEEDAFHSTEMNITIREIVFELLADNPAVAIPLFEVLGNIRSDVKEVRDWFVADYRKRNKPEVPDNFADAKADAEGLKAFIESLYKAMVPMFGSVIQLPDNFDEAFPVKQLEKSGEVKPDLSRIPSGPRENAVGKAGNYARVQFKWNGEDLPKNISTQEVAIRYVSTPTNRISASEIFDKLPHSVKEDGTRHHLAMDTDVWYSIEFLSGILEVMLPGKK